MTVVKFKEILFRVPVFFSKKKKKKKKKKTEHFSKYINIKIEMNLCSARQPNWKIYSPLRETVALMPSYKAKMKYICGSCFMPKQFRVGR